MFLHVSCGVRHGSGLGLGIGSVSLGLLLLVCYCMLAVVSGMVAAWAWV